MHLYVYTYTGIDGAKPRLAFFNYVRNAHTKQGKTLNPRGYGIVGVNLGIHTHQNYIFLFCTTIVLMYTFIVCADSVL